MPRGRHSVMPTMSPTTTSDPGPPFRRVITGVGEDGKAKILHDDTEGAHEVLPSGSRLQTVWWTDSVPVELSEKTSGDPTVGPKNFRITNEGTVGIFAWFPPGQRAPMHSTSSIDYGIVIEGELDSGEKTILKPGDVIVQRETNHAWYNPHPTQWTKIFLICIASMNAVNVRSQQ